jgi:mRNA interferase YafQ
MLIVYHTHRFIKDLKLATKRRKDIGKLEFIMNKLANEESLGNNYHDHLLKGQYVHRRECHVEPNLLLIYKIQDDTIIFERVGSQSDLFK